MKRQTYSVLFHVKRNQQLKNGKLTIYARITINGERVGFFTQLEVEDSEWEPNRGFAIGQTKRAKDVNRSLELIKLKPREYKILMDQNNEVLTAQNLKNRYLGVDDSTKTILGIFRDHNEKCVALRNIDFAAGTVERYLTVYKHIEDFIRFQYKRNDLPLQDINPMFINKFEFYLKKIRSCNHNSTVKYIKNFKKIVRIALANGWMNADPFVSIKFHLDEVDMAYLTEEEL